MFNKQVNANLEKPNAAETIIGPSVKVKGNFHGDGDMVIDGVVEGSIKTKGRLYIGDKAKINANIEAKEARIGGEIIGNLQISGYLNVAGSARINGDIITQSLSIEKGAQINGKINMQNSVQSKTDKHDE
ncbi:cell shape determination protein CcmA [Candidatus Falkowbacteria bacterium CG_4_10_14_0_2_um_filter_48_10]|uniref:Cell shape determination protein CcmA n=1 Tax=Candidatus Falkowbacteria bacterium CG23_combo_of_CG06-09_8_20_14_all_49_15 TaxID=1974572 RepID=A0A2G9ZLA3_9BACT|nr:MAG: cell shape determination protein CcmA [Candidatus Falkowbacteria bacterium CG23_combo_of_CG06-09_8_20_14_all_49_15]PJA08359.1 MAG: cell shape determination protein CcmA [Candidatus Falkowbacteria bacterium CG_4_10_14_0_2_um_filter_48_10]